MNIEEYIHESNAIEGIYSDEQDAQSLVAWDYLKDEPILTFENIALLQGKITLLQPDLRDEYKGVYRSTPKINVIIAGRLAPDPELVDVLIQNFILDYPALDPLAAHIRFEMIHPFVDGNGRTGRMIYWWHCLQNAEEPILFTGNNRQEYYKIFKENK